MSNNNEISGEMKIYGFVLMMLIASNFIFLATNLTGLNNDCAKIYHDADDVSDCNNKLIVARSLGLVANLVIASVVSIVLIASDKNNLRISIGLNVFKYVVLCTTIVARIVYFALIKLDVFTNCRIDPGYQVALVIFVDIQMWFCLIWIMWQCGKQLCCHSNSRIIRYRLENF